LRLAAAPYRVVDAAVFLDSCQPSDAAGPVIIAGNSLVLD